MRAWPQVEIAAGISNAVVVDIYPEDIYVWKVNKRLYHTFNGKTVHVVKFNAKTGRVDCDNDFPSIMAVKLALEGESRRPDQFHEQVIAALAVSQSN